jgi:hypothetical protein
MHKAPGVRIASYCLLFYDLYGIPIQVFFTRNYYFDFPRFQVNS